MSKNTMLREAALNLCDKLQEHADVDRSSVIQVFLGTSLDDVLDAAKELRAALASEAKADATPVVPDGFVLIPVVPNESIRKAMHHAYWQTPHLPYHDNSPKLWNDTYAALVALATPPSTDSRNTTADTASESKAAAAAWCRANGLNVPAEWDVSCTSTHAHNVFENAERFEVPGRGTVFAVDNPVEFPRHKNPFLGTVVTINGDQYFVKGVETFATPIIRVGKPLGLLVKPYSEGEHHV